MNIETLREYCIAKKGTLETFPFGENTLVFKVAGKMYLLTDVTSADLSFNIKCDPEKAAELRERHSCVTPGWHMNKKHWNTIAVDGSVSDSTLREWIDHSYDLVVASLPKKQKEELA
ncbi:MAG: MmcQ/YjbR family DNA-binding protein [Bacteroidota bacterium]|nr:MmcQ/YjbR family DNA-binding protein [Bacteroidota bacterium]